MDLNKVGQTRERYQKQVAEVEEKYEVRGMSHFRHITRNFLGLMIDYEALLYSGKNWTEIRGNYISQMRGLKRYLRLIENFPDFREVEMQNPGQRFFLESPGDPDEYTRYAYQTL